MNAKSAAAASSSSVTVACKLPNGIILRIDRAVTRQEPVMGGGARDVTVYFPSEETYTIKGVAAPAGMLPNQGRVAAGYALTPGIPQAFWELWLEQNKDSDIVKRGLIFANAQTASVRDQARDFAKDKVRSGLEPIDPTNKNDPRMKRRGANPAVGDIITADEQAAKPVLVDADMGD